MSDEARDENLRVMHGARIVLPATWEDSSLYRFNAPLGGVDSTEPASETTPQLQPNVLITRHERSGGDPAERFFEVTNADAKRANSSFEVLREGQTEYLGQLAAWQDVRFLDANTRVEVFQRQLIVPSWPRHFTLITLTGTDAALREMSEQMQLAHLTSAPAPRAEIPTNDGVIFGRLRSKVEE